MFGTRHQGECSLITLGEPNNDIGNDTKDASLGAKEEEGKASGIKNLVITLV